ncbi:transposase [Streptomyces sp. NBC_01764]|uniref:Tn3 family transposase n=1 Tax=Streptomyces sp. NBC_01764 TaxID=2975935 RepID=UPI00224EA23E|nr:Tn3 family transposase [Streptomyces sp. NBC_01764]MCX4403826.1 transposase [Streptomyces sp. NBC_01764]
MSRCNGYVRRRYLSAEAARAIAVQIANATFAARSAELWGRGSTAGASDSTHVCAYDQNLVTEWHSRYGGRGVLIYWHVEKKSLAIHSQLVNCTASEVAAMIEGAMRHGTTMDVEANYTDPHGQSEIGVGITRLLNFDLLPRIKRANKVKLYRPVVGKPNAYPQLTPALTRPIRWELIAQRYDQMIKYATAIRTRTASTEAILRRFTRNASHPTCAAMLEVGRAQKTIFVARYLRLRDLQREIEEGLDVMESSNGANSVIAYGKGGEIASNRRDEQEMFVLCLRILQSALVHVNYLDAPGRPRRAGMGWPSHARGPSWPDPAVLVPRTAVRRGEPRHGRPPQPCRVLRTGPSGSGRPGSAIRRGERMNLRPHSTCAVHAGVSHGATPTCGYPRTVPEPPCWPPPLGISGWDGSRRLTSSAPPESGSGRGFLRSPRPNGLRPFRRVERLEGRTRRCPQGLRRGDERQLGRLPDYRRHDLGGALGDLPAVRGAHKGVVVEPVEERLHSGLGYKTPAEVHAEYEELQAAA